MLGSFARLKMAASAALALGLAAVGSASADTVTYSTTGSFGGTDANVAQTLLNVGGTTLTYVGQAGGFTSVPNFPTTVTLGYFVLSSTTLSPNTDTFASNDTFTVHILQTPPGSTGNSTASVTGTVNFTSGGVAVLTFTPNPLLIGQDSYHFLPEYDVSVQDAIGTDTLNVKVTETPLPATASMGLGLFGVIGVAGGLNALRRRRAAAAL